MTIFSERLRMACLTRLFMRMRKACFGFGTQEPNGSSAFRKPKRWVSRSTLSFPKICGNVIGTVTPRRCGRGSRVMATAISSPCRRCEKTERGFRSSSRSWRSAMRPVAWSASPQSCAMSPSDSRKSRPSASSSLNDHIPPLSLVRAAATLNTGGAYRRAGSSVGADFARRLAAIWLRRLPDQARVARRAGQRCLCLAPPSPRPLVLGFLAAVSIASPPRLWHRCPWLATIPPRRPNRGASDGGWDERHRPFVADLGSHGAQLRKAQMMRVGRAAAAHEAGQGAHELEMRLIAHPPRSAEGQHGFIDLGNGTAAIAPRVGCSVFVGLRGWARLQDIVEPHLLVFVDLAENLSVVQPMDGLELGPFGAQPAEGFGLAGPERLELFQPRCPIDALAQIGAEALRPIVPR